MNDGRFLKAMHRAVNIPLTSHAPDTMNRLRLQSLRGQRWRLLIWLFTPLSRTPCDR